MAFRVRPTAKADTKAIARYIAARNPQAARRWLAQIDERIARLGEMPGLGAPRPHLMLNLRLLPAGNYVILYLHVGDDADVLRVVRRWENLLR